MGEEPGPPSQSPPRHSPAASKQNTCSGRRRLGSWRPVHGLAGRCGAGAGRGHGAVARLSSPSQRGSGSGGLWEASPQAPGRSALSRSAVEERAHLLACPHPGRAGVSPSGVTREACRCPKVVPPVPAASGEHCRSPVRPQCSWWLPRGDQCNCWLSITVAVNHLGTSSRT